LVLAVADKPLNPTVKIGVHTLVGIVSETNPIAPDIGTLGCVKVTDTNQPAKVKETFENS
jgi:hypothetical protein